MSVYVKEYWALVFRFCLREFGNLYVRCGYANVNLSVGSDTCLCVGLVVVCVLEAELFAVHISIRRRYLGISIVYVVCMS